MKIKVLFTGKTTEAWIRQGIEVYAGRIRHYVSFELVEIPDLRQTASLSEDQIRQREGDMILKALKPGDHLVLLDERGASFSSLDWARNLEQKAAHLPKDLVFVIGGPYGFSQAVYQRCHRPFRNRAGPAGALRHPARLRGAAAPAEEPCGARAPQTGTAGGEVFLPRAPGHGPGLGGFRRPAGRHRALLLPGRYDEELDAPVPHQQRRGGRLSLFLPAPVHEQPQSLCDAAGLHRHAGEICQSGQRLVCGHHPLQG